MSDESDGVDPVSPIVAVVQVEPVTEKKSHQEAEVEEDKPWPITTLLKGWLGYILHQQTLKVASITMANGADNLGVYIPLFASSTGAEIAIVLIVFFIFTAVWLLTSWLLLKFPPIAAAIERFGEYVVPVALIALGIFIMYEANTITLVD